MGLQRTKLLGISSVTGNDVVGIYTVGVTPTAGGVGVASTTYLRSIVMHSTGLATCVSSVYIYPNSETDTTKQMDKYRLGRVDLASNDTYFFEFNYPLVMTHGDKIVVEVSAPTQPDMGVGVGSMVNYQILGDTDI